MAIDLWTRKYLPKTLDEYVWRDLNQRKKVQEWLDDRVVPHLMFSGLSGTGKSALLRLILSLLGIPDEDILIINASRERKIEDIQDKIISFISGWAFNDTGMKYVVLEEADAMSRLAQQLLRAEIEQYEVATRFFFTCNYPEKIIPAIKGRCQAFHFDALDQEEFIMRLITILETEGVTYGDEALSAVVSATYPDLRKCINLAQQSVVGGVLQIPPKEDANHVPDYLVEVSALFKAGRLREGRTLLVAQAPADEYPDLYRYMYRNLDLWGETEDQKDDALLIIRRGLVNHSLVADPEINLAATLVELCRVSKQ